MQKNNFTNLVVGPVSTNCWIYPIGDSQAAIIDPGDEADKIIFTLKKLNLAPKYILLTHGHFDHICGVPELALMGNPQIAIHWQDAENLGPDCYPLHQKSVKACFGDAAFLDVYWHDMPSADILLDEGSVIGPFTVLHLPGHTPGSIAFWDKDRDILFTGDTLFAKGFGRIDLPGGNAAQLFSSLKRLFDMPPNTIVCPGHGKTTTIGQEKRVLPAL